MDFFKTTCGLFRKFSWFSLLVQIACTVEAPQTKNKICLASVLQRPQNFFISKGDKPKRIKLKQPPAPIFFNVNAKKNRFYAEGAINFTGMCSTTYSYLSK
jgi:hypothetical protein